MNREPLEHGKPWHEAGRRCDSHILECQRLAKILDDIAEELLVAIGHTRHIQRRITNLLEPAA